MKNVKIAHCATSGKFSNESEFEEGEAPPPPPQNVKIIKSKLLKIKIFFYFCRTFSLIF